MINLLEIIQKLVVDDDNTYIVIGYDRLNEKYDVYFKGDWGSRGCKNEFLSAALFQTFIEHRNLINEVKSQNEHLR